MARDGCIFRYVIAFEAMTRRSDDAPPVGQLQYPCLPDSRLRESGFGREIFAGESGLQWL